MDIQKYWSAVLRQDAAAMASFFAPGARVNWHNTNEHFTAAEFIRANCAYPGKWEGEIEHLIQTPTHFITALRVWPRDGSASFHATSFIRVEDGKIRSVDEYWGDDTEAPAWRKEMHIGKRIR